MLLSSPQFSNFLDHLSTNPTALPRQQQQQPQQQPAKVEQRQPEAQQVPKDVNPYAALPNQQQQIGMALVPEQTMDFSMLSLENDSFNYQPQVFTVLDTPEMPELDASILSGKASHSEVESACSDNEKLQVSPIEDPVAPSYEKTQFPAGDDSPVSTASAADLDSDIYEDDAVPMSKATESEPASVEIFGGVDSEKAFARIELVDATEADAASDSVVRRVERLSASLESTLANLERLTVGL
jgi:bZIP-type transcription factor MBZ1